VKVWKKHTKEEQRANKIKERMGRSVARKGEIESGR